jgi:hypothetical protein
MVQDISALFQKTISWHSTKPGSIEFYAYVDGERCELCLRDSPPESLRVDPQHSALPPLEDLPNSLEQIGPGYQPHSFSFSVKRPAMADDPPLLI